MPTPTRTRKPIITRRAAPPAPPEDREPTEAEILAEYDAPPEARTFATRPDPGPDLLVPSLPGWIAPPKGETDLGRHLREMEAAAGSQLRDMSIGAEYARLADEDRDITRKLRELRKQGDTAGTRRKVAQDRDRDAAAIALRRRQPDPGDRFTTEHDEAERARERDVEVLVRARGHLLADMAQLAARPGLPAEVEARRRAAREARVAALEAFTEATADLAALEAVDGWIESGGRRLRPPANHQVPGIGATLGEVIGALATLDGGR